MSEALCIATRSWQKPSREPTSEPKCFPAYLDWSRCIQTNRDCTAAFETLIACVKRHGIRVEVDG